MDTIVIALVAAIVGLFFILNKRKPGPSLNMENLRQAAEIEKARVELVKLTTESTKDTQVYKDAKAAYDAKYKSTGRKPLTVVGVVDGGKSSPDDSKS
jgi:hypothetical protein